MGLRYDEIGEILKLIDESSCDEFVLETEDIKLVVRRHGANSHTVESNPDSKAIFVEPSTSEQKARPETPAVRGTPAHAVSAPMVGTFYRSPSPGAPAFVDIGSTVSKGDPICIIEVMKLFTTVHAEWSGTVTEIGPENAQPVEYGQMLFVITPE
jgi:acetyl-CoA carboxylase biotin carboxyl carrier protein